MPKRKTADRKKCDKAKTQYHQRASLKIQMQLAKNYEEYTKLYKRFEVIQ